MGTIERGRHGKAAAGALPSEMLTEANSRLMSDLQADSDCMTRSTEPGERDVPATDPASTGGRDLPAKEPTSTADRAVPGEAITTGWPTGMIPSLSNGLMGSLQVGLGPLIGATSTTGERDGPATEPKSAGERDAPATEPTTTGARDLPTQATTGNSSIATTPPG